MHSEQIRIIRAFLSLELRQEYAGDDEPEQQCGERPVVFENDLCSDESDTPEEHGSQCSQVYVLVAIKIPAEFFPTSPDRGAAVH